MAFLLVALVLCASPLSAQNPGQPAPAFVLPSLDGPPVRLHDLRGQPLVLVFWAFWCDTWKEVHTGLTDLARDRQRLDFDMATVSIDCQWTDQLLPLVSRREVPYRTLTDPGGQVSHAWGVKAVPTVCVIDATGVLRARWEGYPGTPKLRDLLRRLTPR